MGITFNNQQSTAQPQTLIAQASKTGKIVVNEFGYSFDVPSWARVIKDGSGGKVSFSTAPRSAARWRTVVWALLCSIKRVESALQS